MELSYNKPLTEEQGDAVEAILLVILNDRPMYDKACRDMNYGGFIKQYTIGKAAEACGFWRGIKDIDKSQIDLNPVKATVSVEFINRIEWIKNGEFNIENFHPHIKKHLINLDTASTHIISNEEESDMQNFKKPVEKKTLVFGIELLDRSEDDLIKDIREARAYCDGFKDLVDSSKKVKKNVEEANKAISMLLEELDRR